MLTTQDFLELSFEERAALLSEHFLEKPLPGLYPNWISTGAIIDRLKMLGFHTQLGVTPSGSNVAIFSFLEEESYNRATVFLQAADFMEREEGTYSHAESDDVIYVSLNHPHDAVAIAALMAVNVIEIPPHLQQ